MKKLNVLLVRFLVIPIVFCLVIFELSASHQDDEEKYNKQGCKLALEILIPVANQTNNGLLQNKIGELYHFKEAIQDFDKAKEWYLKAVKNGNGEAANHLGRLYLNGEGVTKDYSAALDWYRKGMELGDPYAKENYISLKGTVNTSP